MEWDSRRVRIRSPILFIKTTLSVTKQRSRRRFNTFNLLPVRIVRKLVLTNRMVRSTLDAGGDNVPRELTTPIARAYKEKGLTAEEVAQHANISVSYMYELASGKKTPSLETLSKLCRILEKKPEELYPAFFVA